MAGEGGSEVKQPHLPLTKTSVNKLHCSPTARSCCGAVRGGREACGGAPGNNSPLAKRYWIWGSRRGCPLQRRPASDWTSPAPRTAGRDQVRCSPRKLGLSSQWRNSGESGTTSPTLHIPTYHSPTRNPSFQTSRTTNRLPLFRASLTQHPSSLQASSPLPTTSGSSCSCPGHLKVCTSCQAHSHLHAARAGTPVVRPPEVEHLHT